MKEFIQTELDGADLNEIDRLAAEAAIPAVYETFGDESGSSLQNRSLEQERIPISPVYFRTVLKMFLRKGMAAQALKWLEALPANTPKMLHTTFSVIMITKNRADRIQAALRALKDLAYPSTRYEIIVVDNGSTDHTEMVAKEELSTASCKTAYIYQPNGCLCTARNAGIAAAGGDWIGFIDDDAICRPDWILHFLLGLLAVPDAVGMGGPVELPPEYRTPGWWRPRHSGLLSCKQGPSQISTLKKLENPYGLNMWIKGSIFRKVGNFDERMDIWCPTIADETELFIRIQKTGGTVIFVPEAKVTHYVHISRLTYFNLIRRSFLVGRSQQTLDWLHAPYIYIGVSLVKHLRRALRVDQSGPLFVSIPIELSLWLGYRFQKRFIRKNRLDLRRP